MELLYLVGVDLNRPIENGVAPISHAIFKTRWESGDIEGAAYCLYDT